MAKYLPLPDGSSLKVADDMSYDEAMAKARVKFPDLFQATTAAPKEGLMADVMGAGSNLLNIGRTGIAALTGDATQAAQAGLTRQEELQKKYKSGFEPEKVFDKFNQGEYLGAAGEAIRQVPSAMASLVPSIGQEFGLAAAGRLGGGALGALAGPAGAVAGAQVGQYAVPFLVNAIQALGGQAQEKIQTQKEAGEKPDVSALELAPYAAVNAAFNLVGTKIAMPSVFKNAIGKKVAEETADAAAAAARKELIDEARKVAGRGTLETIARGTGGFALGELPTEILQDVVDRAAVGKPLADDDAFKSYRATALNMVLASPLGGGLGVHERMGARSTVATEDRQIAAKQAAEQAAADQAARNTPEYALKIADDYAAAEKAKADLIAQKRKITKDSPTATADKAFNAELNQQLQDLAPELSRLGAEYNRLAPAIKQIQVTQIPGYQAQLPGFEPAGTTAPPTAEPTTEAPVDYAQQVRQLQQLDEDQQVQLAQTSDPEELIKLLDRQDKTRAALADAIKAAAATPKSSADKLARITRHLKIAKKEGDSDQIRKYAQQLLELKAEGLTSRQQEIPLARFKNKSETTAQFNKRTYEPQGDLQEQQTSLLEQPYADYLSDQEMLDRMRQDGFTEQDIARMEKQAQMGKSATVSEQGLLFGQETNSGIQSGEKRAAPTASRAELQAEIQIARETGNKAAANRAQKQLDDLAPSEKGEDKFAGTTAQRQGDFARARQPVRVSQQQDAADARAQAYADMVSIVSKYNKGLAKADELETARAAVVDNLITDIEATRGVAVSEEEASVIRAQANQLLYDLVSRFGDTRNLSQKDKDLFLPAQNKDGSFSASPVEGRGFPTVESRAPGRQTFAKQYAASQSIKEGLNELKNKAVATNQTTVERKLSVAQDTEKTLRAELDRAFARGDIPANQREVLEAIADNLQMFNINPERRSMAAAYAARINARVAPSAELTSDIKAELATIERAKRSETQIETRERFFGGGTKVTTAQQQELFASDKELQGYIFDTPAAFDKWLASDALQQMRSSVGLGMPTISRLLQRLAPFQKRADAFRAQADALTTRIENLGAQYQALQTRKAADAVSLREMSSAERTARSAQLRLAQEMLSEAEANLKAVQDRMDAELTAYQQEFIQAETAFNFSVKTSEDITKAIAANTTEFQKGEMAAIRKVLDAKKELDFLLNKLKSDMFPGGADKTAGKNWASVLEDFSKDKKVVVAQQKIVDATRQWRASFALNQTQSRVVAFLDKDLNFQMQLQEEANQMDELVSRMLNAKLTLDLAFKQQQRKPANKAELRAAGQDMLAARDLVSKAETALADVTATEKALLAEMNRTNVNVAAKEDVANFVDIMKAATDLEKQLASEMRLASAERAFQLAEAARLTPKMPAQTRLGAPKNETKADREARDNAERNTEQTQIEALQALPAERVSFEKRRKLLDVVNAVPERVLELDAVIDGADEMIANTQARAERVQAEIAALDVQIAASAKKVFSKGKGFKNKLERQSEKIVLDRLREERAALVATLPRVETEVAQIKAEQVDAQGKKTKLLTRAAEIEQQFANDVQYNAEGEALPNPIFETINARIPKVQQNIAKNEDLLQNEKGQSAKLRESRERAVRKYKRELASLEARRDTKRGIERAPVAKGRIEAAPDEDVVGSERLPARKIGPVVRKIGVGQGKVLQAGQVRPITGLQAQRSANVVSLDALRKKVADAQETAKQAALAVGKAKAADSDAALQRSDAADNALYAAELELQTAIENSKTGPQRRKEAAAEQAALAAESAVEDVVNQSTAGKIPEEPSFARGVEVESPDLTPTQVMSLQENDIGAALQDMASDKGTSTLNRAVAQRLAILLDKTNSEIVPGLTDKNGKEVLGMATSRMVSLNQNGGLSQEVLLHEGTHAGTERVIQMYEIDPSMLSEMQRVAIRELKMLHAAAKADPRITSVNAKSSLSEFVAEVMSNRNLQEQLRKKPWKLSDAFAGFKSIIMRMLGVEKTDTMLGSAITAIDALFVPPSYRYIENGTVETPVAHVLAQKDIAALEDGSNSMREFAAQFGIEIKQKDRTPEDADRIGKARLEDMKANPLDYIAPAESEKLDYRAIMSDGKPYDADNPLHFVEADVAYPESKLIAPNRIGDVAPVQALVEAPEVPVYAPKAYGVKDEGKGRFSFTSRRTPGEFDATPEPSAVDKFFGNVLGLAGRMQLVDKFAAVSEAFKVGMSKGVLTDVEAGNAEYLLRFGEHRSQLATQFLTNGSVSLVTTKTDRGIEHTYQSTKGANAMQMAEALNKGGFASDSEAEGLLTIITSGERAKQVDWAKLNYSDPAAAKAKYERALAHLDANPKQKEAIKEAMAIYQKINAGQMDFLVQTGELTATKAAELKAITYVPYYRVNANGEVQLMIDKERPVRIGNIKDEPQLQQLVGDNKEIMPIFASMVQNTFMLTNLGLRNQSVKETAFMLRKIGIASRIANGPGPASPNTVRFKQNGVDMHVVIDTDMYGIPAKYIVEGMEGIKTTIPAVVKLLGMPADILRKFVTRAPPYAIRQTIRDPLNAWLTTGTDAIPVLSSFKELATMVAGRSETERTLMESGAVSSNVFTGDERDMSKVLREITSGKSGWSKLLAKADAFALQGDTATRATIYKDSIAKGMSHQQALLRSVESMNFSRRGLSPSIQMLSTMIPFFNAQIQGLDVLYRAFKGDMTHNEQLQIREKLFQRGMLLAIGTMAYAAAMQDDEAYKRAKPEERYSNWFVYVPGVSEPLRVPIPFELGYLFKSLPEAVYNLAAGDEKAGEVVKGMGKLLGQSNPFALPQAIKPLTEVVLGKSFFGGDIESEREKQTLAKDRYRENSTEVAKLLGSVTGAVGVSPIKIDYLIRGYTGGLGIALVQLANPLLNTETTAVEKPSTKPSKMPFIGGLFQPVEGRGTLDSAYDKMQEIQQVKGSYNKLVEEGKRAEAAAFVQEYSNQLALVSTSGSVQKALGEMAKQERAIRSAPKLTTAQKDAALERLDKMKVAYARQFLSLADRTTPR